MAIFRRSCSTCARLLESVKNAPSPKAVKQALLKGPWDKLNPGGLADLAGKGIEMCQAGDKKGRLLTIKALKVLELRIESIPRAESKVKKGSEGG